jgi:hypothetical protein
VGWPLCWEDGSVVYNCCLPLPAPSFLGPSPIGLMAVFYCFKFETPPTWRARSSYLYPPGTGWPSYTHGCWVHFALPPITYRAAVEISEPSFTQACLTQSQELLYDWQFSANQFILAPSPLRLMAKSFFFPPTEHLQSESLCNILSDKRMGPSFTFVAGPHQRSHSQV